MNPVRDCVPAKYERMAQNDIIIKYLTFLILGTDGLIFFGTVQSFVYRFETPLFVVNFVCLVLFFALNVAWLHYKLQHIIMGGYKVFMDLSRFQTNSKYYSGLEIPDSFLQGRVYPHLTIQLPVYKEDLENTIAPTLKNALREAKRYTKETGAYCNIIVCDDGFALISDEEREKRRAFYRANGIGYTARPSPAKYKRNGRFKKAGNLNFSMNFSGVTTRSQTESSSLDPLFKEFKRVVELGAQFEGHIKYGSYIFLVDSDTRLPEFPPNENGCFKRLIKDMMFDGENAVLYMQCFTSPYLSTKSISEKCVFHFTCHIYNGILVGTAFNSMAPLVGHNALLNQKILQKIAHVNPDTHYVYYWDENRISEDFDCMMRGCENGYIGRYVSSSGIYYEGVSFSYLTEYFKVSKFACGAAELTFNPVNRWFQPGGGFFSSDIWAFIWCKEIEWYNKISILSYVLNFIAIAQANIAMFYNLIFFEELFDVLPFVLIPVNLMWEGMLVWGVLNTIINVLFSFRVKFDTWTIIRQQFRELFFTSALYGSLSVRFMIMYLGHFLNWEISFGSTQKDDEQVTLRDWVNSTKYECIIYTGYFACIVVRIFVFPIKSYYHTFYFGCLPLFMNIFWYWFGPLAYDVLPKKRDKTGTKEYIAGEKMFEDKYGTQIPKSEIFMPHVSPPISWIEDSTHNDVYVCIGGEEQES